MELGILSEQDPLWLGAEAWVRGGSNGLCFYIELEALGVDPMLAFEHVLKANSLGSVEKASSYMTKIFAQYEASELSGCEDGQAQSFTQ